MTPAGRALDRALLTWVAALGALAAQRIIGLGDAGLTPLPKADGTPLTRADLLAHQTIVQFLRADGWAVVSEEDDAPAPAIHARYFLVDPLDGTREFIAGRAHYTVNLALIEHGQAVLGVIAVPARAAIYLALNPRDRSQDAAAWRICLAAQGQESAGGSDESPAGAQTAHKAWVHLLAKQPWERIRCASLAGAQAEHAGDPRRWRALVSASHLDARTSAWLAAQRVDSTERLGSALKFCVLAEGGAEVYPRFAPTMEWDTAAGQAIVEAAGGSVCLPNGSPLRYGKEGWRNGDFIAWGQRGQGQALQDLAD